VNRLRAMAGLNHSSHLFRDGLNHRWIAHRKIKQLDSWSIRKKSRDGVRDDEGVGGHLRLAEGIHALAKSSDQSKWKPAQLDDFADCSFGRTIDLAGHFFGDQADLVVSMFVLLIEKAARNDDQITH